MFPSRVNVVYGKRWAIAKKQHGNCRVDIVHVSEVEKERQFRKNGDVKWLIQKDGRSEGFLIRNDHHPRRALTGGIPMMLESVSRSNINQRWLLCFPRGPPGPHEPFFIKSAISGMYLVVDEGLRMVTLQKDPPDLHWRTHDATRKAESFSTSLVVPSSVQTPCGGQLEEALALPDLEPYDGDVSSAFREGPASGRSVADVSSPPDLDASSSFTPVEQMLHEEMVLCDAHELLPEGSGLAPADVFQRLWGRGTSFVQSYQARRNGRDVFWSGPGISENRPWEAFAELTCSVRVPVLGWRPYQEVMRFALCYEPAAFAGKFSAMDVSEVLAVQLVGNVDAGSMGNFRSENLMLFYQPMCPGPTVLRALALTPKGRFSSMAVDGHRKALSDFIHAVQEEAKKWHVNGHQPVKAAVVDAKAKGPPAEDCCFAGVCSLKDTCALM
ncbi:unnamed protein product [Symbiodinium sp. CCMP2456]|nr:unnamed protein product [Symbiodinium sp. CCMP2456]